MARQITNLEGIAQMFLFTLFQIYKLVRRPVDQLPHRKIGKHLRFDVEKFLKWFDRQLGEDHEEVDV